MNKNLYTYDNVSAEMVNLKSIINNFIICVLLKMINEFQLKDIREHRKDDTPTAMITQTV